MLYIIHSTISAQQTNLLPENASQNDGIFPKSQYGIYQTTSQCLSSYGCAIIVQYSRNILIASFTLRESSLLCLIVSGRVSSGDFLGSSMTIGELASPVTAAPSVLCCKNIYNV